MSQSFCMLLSYDFCLSSSPSLSFSLDILSLTTLPVRHSTELFDLVIELFNFILIQLELFSIILFLYWNQFAINSWIVFISHFIFMFVFSWVSVYEMLLSSLFNITEVFYEDHDCVVQQMFLIGYHFYETCRHGMIYTLKSGVQLDFKPRLGMGIRKVQAS